MRRITAAVLLAAGLLAGPGRAQERYFRSELRLLLEVGISRTDEQSLDRLHGAVDELIAIVGEGGVVLEPRARQQIGELLQCGNLPLTCRLYVPGFYDREARSAPPYHLLVIDTAGSLPLTPASAPPPTPGGAAQRRFVREQKTALGRRYLLGDDAAALQAELPHFIEGARPRVPTSHRRILGRVDASLVHAFVDLGAFLPDGRLARLRAAGGPNAAILAAAIDLEDDRCRLDLHWGAAAGRGIIGSMLPSDTRRARLDDYLPWPAGLVLQADLGPELARDLARLELPALAGPDGVLGEAISTAIGAWRGQIGIFQREPRESPETRDHSLLLSLSEQTLFVVRVEADAGPAVIEQLREAIPGVAEDEAARSWRLDRRGTSLHFAQRSGFVVMSLARTPDDAASSLAEFLAAATRGERAEADNGGPIQLRLTPRICAGLLRHAALGQHLPLGPMGTRAWKRWLGRISTHGLELTLDWDSRTTWLRCRF